MKVRKYRKGQQGFTLIELLVVVAIIALLAAVAVPKLFDAINKAKTGKGTADLDTISSALERNYFDLNLYPVPTASSPLDSQMKNQAYVKAQTTFQNGYNKGFLYQTSGTGSYYVLADPANASGQVKIVCGTWQSAAFTVTTSVVSDTSLAGPSQTDIAAGCLVKSWNGTVVGAQIPDSKVVTN